MNGWIKLPRSIIDRPWFRDRDGKTLRLYIFLAVSAYSQDQEFQGVKVRRGSCPITRAQMQEGTGLSYKEVHNCLNRLQRLGELIVKGNNKFSVATIVNYEEMKFQNSLFSEQGNNHGTTTEQQGEQPRNTTPINNKNIEYRNNNLISLNKPYKKERENNSVAYEIKKLYNTTFNGILPPCLRLSTLMRLSCEECISRFGRQSVDIVFEQIRKEPFSMGKGKNRTGFIADFTFIFTPINYQKYLERATLRRQKAIAPQAITAQPQQNEQPLSKEEKAQRRRQEIIEMVAAVSKDPESYQSYRAKAVMGLYQSGELQRLGITLPPRLLELIPANPSKSQQIPANPSKSQ